MDDFLRKRLCLLVFLLSGFFFLPAQERFFNLGLGVEGNMNTTQGYALGQSVSVDYSLFKRLSLGASVMVSSDFFVFSTIEPAFFGRWYFFKPRNRNGGFFVQADIGMSLVFEAGDAESGFMGGLSTGFRHYFGFSDYYIEPAVRGGYPFLWGFGLKAGCRL